MVKTLLKVFGILVVLLAATALLVPRFISIDDITQGIIHGVEESTGRTLAVDGKKSLAVFPSLALQLHEVRFSNTPGGSRPDMAAIESLYVHIPWLSLFSGELNVENFVVNDPDILLEIDSSGNANWNIMPTDDPAKEAEPEETAVLPVGFDISLGEVAIYGGRIHLLDHQAGSSQSVEGLDLVVGLPSLKKNLTIDGAVTWMDELLELNVTLTTPADLLTGKPFGLELVLESRLVNMLYRGSISEDGSRVTGALEVAGDSMKELAAWQGIYLEGSDGAFNSFVIGGDIVFAGDVFEIRRLEAKLDALEIKGRGTLKLTEPLFIQADMDLGMLDLNPYLPPAADPEDMPRDSDPDSPPEPVEWDDNPIDLSALRSVDAEVSLRSSGLRARDITLDENTLNLRMLSGKLDLRLEKFIAYQGSGSGNVSVDARRAPYGVTTDFNLAGINAQPLLTDIMDFDRLAGSGKLQWQLETRGISQRDFVSALNGRVSFKFSDGAIRGANIAAMVRSAESLVRGDASGFTLARGFDQAAQTDFSELGGTLLFTKGVGRNNDLKMASPLLRVSGEGEVDLPGARVDYGLTARLVNTIEGQGATGKSKGVAVPLRVKGPFHDVKIKPDVSEAAQEQVKEKLKGTVKDELLKRFGR